MAEPGQSLWARCAGLKIPCLRAARVRIPSPAPFSRQNRFVLSFIHLAAPYTDMWQIPHSALARYFIHQYASNSRVGMGESVAFLQILDTSKLEPKTSKKLQWQALENSINGILPLRNSSIRAYRIFYGNDSDFKNPSRIEEIASFTKKSCEQRKKTLEKSSARYTCCR